jgi:hypothetical protein
MIHYPQHDTTHVTQHDTMYVTHVFIQICITVAVPKIVSYSVFLIQVLSDPLHQTPHFFAHLRAQVLVCMRCGPMYVMSCHIHGVQLCGAIKYLLMPMKHIAICVYKCSQ